MSEIEITYIGDEEYHHGNCGKMMKDVPMLVPIEEARRFMADFPDMFRIEKEGGKMIEKEIEKAKPFPDEPPEAKIVKIFDKKSVSKKKRRRQRKK